MTPARAILESLLALCPLQKFAYIIESINNVNSVNTVNTVPSVGHNHTIGEIELLRLLIPKDITSRLGELGTLGHYFTSTFLRHRATQMHVFWLINRLYMMDLSIHPRILDLVSLWNLEVDFRDFKYGLGFSPLGFHRIERGLHVCSAFDLYDCDVCAKGPFRGLFCSEHTLAHSWWTTSDDDHLCVQGKMFLFYSQQDSIDTYSQQELDNLVNQFFNQLRRAPNKKDFENALSFFGLKDIHECKTKGPSWLKRKYKEMAYELHPDRGGTHEAFCLLEESYTCLVRASFF